MPYYTPVEQKLGVQLTPDTHGFFTAAEPVDAEKLVKEGKAVWQNLMARDCGNGDGVDYVVVNTPEGEFMVGMW